VSREDATRPIGGWRIWAACALTAALLGAALLGSSVAGAAGDDATRPTVGVAESYSLSPAARDLSAARRDAGGAGHAAPRINPMPGRTGEGVSARGHDPLASGGRAPGRTPAPGLTFEGQDNGCGCLPPDTTGDVGPNHYIQLVNSTGVGIHNKTTGALVTPVFDLGALWPAANTCRVGFGDPQVLYDEQADRWNLVQFDDVGNRLCWAVSQTGNPTGAYHLFEFTVPQFPDYFKVGVWPSGYYVGTNENTYTAYAFNRAKMLAGDATANFVRFPGETNFLMPADVDGPSTPSGGGLFYTFKDNAFHGGADRIELFRLTPNFATPASSTFTMINSFPIASFTYTVCGFFEFECIPQPGGAPKLDAVSEWPMQRFAYRGDVGGHETLVGNFTVKSHATNATSAGAGIRWFELRNTGTGWSLFQEGTHDPNDGIDRFMGSISMDAAGDIALGYSASSTTLNPSIRYATRLPGDPAGTFEAERTLQAGGGSQTSESNRWGDYSAMAVDPADGCNFWYTNEYYPATSDRSWHTRVGKFAGPSCLALVASPGSVDFGPHAVGTSSAFQTVTVTNTGAGAVTIASAGLASGDTGEFQAQNDTCTGATLNPSETCSIDATFSPTAAGPRASVLRFTDDASGSPHDVVLSGTGTTVEPSNQFTFGKLKRNKKKGTAIQKVEVPGPGDLALAGKGVKHQRAASARRAGAAKPVAAAGTVGLKVKAKGKKKKKLKRTGKVKVKIKVTYTPTGGTPNTESKRVKLKLKRR
jgi:hypothetical protein